MLDLIYGNTEELRFKILSNSTKEVLLPIVINNIKIIYEEMEEQNSLRTRIYSDCYSPYQINDFYNLRYRLK